MVKYKRLAGYIIDYFPEPKYSSQDIRDWATKNVPAWKVIKESDKKEIIQDWEDFVAPVFREEPKTWIRKEEERHRRRLREFRRWRRR